MKTAPKGFVFPAETKFSGTLTIQSDRGVVYFHDENGECLLRLEGLPTPLPDPHEAQLDVRHMKGVAWNAPRREQTVFCGVHPGHDHKDCEHPH